MKKVLIINASARTLHSHSRKLTEVFTEDWIRLHNDSEIRHRELGNVNVPHISEAWILANHKPKTNRTAEDHEILATSDAYIAELKNADLIVLGMPMYNWSIPSTLKAYIDQILRLNETFKIDLGNRQQPYTGLLENKTMLLLVARGGQGYETGEPNSHLNFQTTYLRTVLNMIGIHNIHMVDVSGTSFDKEVLEKTIEQAHRQVKAVIEMLK
ncbi:NAD(P)H-dependent oxidoreductase [Chitinophaga sp. GbtcB8]|uniref:FMN-dependent NADH-azoreductase n=1 Tax=Chitinophaga sp. GbtcB8 TaxID=2824753 RepID=UPI001C300760